MSDAGPAGACARHVLHLNLNVVDLDASARFYGELLGLDVRMRTSGDDGDWRFHGLAEPVASDAWFLYDDRGPRTAPALELIRWRRPATEGESYPHLAHRGLSSLGFRVPSLDGLAAAAVAAGGLVVGEIDGDETGDALLVRDPDGVFVELFPAEQPDAPGSAWLRHARIGCADLTRTLAWYATMGFQVVAEPAPSELVVAGEVLRLRTARVALAPAGGDGGSGGGPGPSMEFVLTEWLHPQADEPARARLWFRGLVRMAVSVEDIDASAAALRRGGLACDDPMTFPMTGTAIDELRVLFLADPDGLTLELVHRPARHFAGSRRTAAQSTAPQPTATQP